MRKSRTPSKRAKPAPEAGRKQTVQAGLKWGPIDGVETYYVNQLFLSNPGGEYSLVFGEAVIPPFLDAADFPEKLTIVPRVRLTIAPDAMRKIAKVIAQNVIGTEPESGE